MRTKRWKRRKVRDGVSTHFELFSSVCVFISSGPQDVDVEVDVTTVDPVNAFLSSDEEGEDPNTLLYLPVSPDIDPEDEQQTTEAQQVLVQPRFRFAPDP